MIDGARFLWAERPIVPDEKAAGLLMGAGDTIAALAERLPAAEWTAEALEAVARTYADEAGLKLGKVAQPLRAALTGRTTSPPVFDVMVALGREETLARLADRS